MEKELNLEEIKKRCEKASPGPWKAWVEGRDGTSGSTFIMVGEGEHRGEDIELPGIAEADIDFMAHARQDIPALIKEIEMLRSGYGNNK